MVVLLLTPLSLQPALAAFTFETGTQHHVLHLVAIATVFLNLFINVCLFNTAPSFIKVVLILGSGIQLGHVLRANLR